MKNFQWLKIEAKIALGLGTLGLLLALHIPIVLLQGLGLTVELNPPFPLFGVLMLGLWLQGALVLSWPTIVEPISSISKSFLRGERLFFGIAIGLALPISFLERIALLLPHSDGGLPASDYDEMVYYSGSALIADGKWPYRDFLLVHPPLAEFIYAAWLKLGRLFEIEGGETRFLFARYLTVLLGLLTVVGVGWVAGRIWQKENGFAFVPAGMAALVYALDARVNDIATLETPANFLAVLGLGCYFEGEERQANGRWWWTIGGSLLAFSTLCKLPGGAVILGLGFYLILCRRWQVVGWVGLGLAFGAMLVALPLIWQVGMSELLRQVLLFQVLRPQEVREGIDQLSRLAVAPQSVFTIWLAGLALALLAWQLITNQRLGRRFLIPVMWSIPLLVIFILGKSFHPWYYVQWALPLSLIAGGGFSHRFSHRFSSRSQLYGLATVLIGIPLIWLQWQSSQTPEFDRVYRGTALALKEQANKRILAFDPGYSFMVGLTPVRVQGKYLVDSAGYAVYLNLRMDERSIADLLASFSQERGQVEALFKGEQAQALLMTGLSEADFAVLDGKIALPQLTTKSVEFIETTGVKTSTIDYAQIYQIRPLAVRKAWQFDNGLSLMPFGLSSSQAGKANFDMIEVGEVLKLKVGQVRQLDLRLVWQVGKPQSQAIKLFVHVVDEVGNKVAQQDLRPLGDKADSRTWQQYDAYQDVVSLPLPSDLKIGRYKVTIGIYEPQSGRRSLLGQGQDSLTIGYLEIIN